MFTELFPILSTRDLDRAVRFYVDHLDGTVGYRFPTDDPAIFVSLRVAGSTLAFSADPDAPVGRQRAVLWVYAEQCDAAVDRLLAAGATLVEPAVDQPWGERVARIADPDGNEIVIGSVPG